MSNDYHGSWIYFSNPFYTQTQRSYKRFFELSSDHLASLQEAAKTKVQIDELVSDYYPLHEAFCGAYVELQSARNVLQGMTQKVEQKQESLVKRIGKWDVRLQTVFYSDTPEYQTLLPNKRSPFQTGQREQRLQTLKVFVKNLANYPELAALETEVKTFYQNFITLREEQQRQQTKISQITERLKRLHKAAAAQMYRNLGMLIYLYETSYELAAFFKLSVVRNLGSKEEDSEEESPEDGQFGGGKDIGMSVMAGGDEEEDEFG